MEDFKSFTPTTPSRQNTDTTLVDDAVSFVPSTPSRQNTDSALVENLKSLTFGTPSRQSTSSTLVDDQDAPIRWSYLRHVIRLLRFDILPEILAPYNDSEGAKVVIHRSRKTALLTASHQILPLSIAVALVALNLRVTVLGSVNGTTLTTLQFAAKIVEVLIQASISMIVLDYTRWRLLSTKGFPLGAIFGAYRLCDLSFLWSLELWAAVRPLLRQRANALLIPLLLGSVFLAGVVGPATAVLLIPRYSKFMSTPSLALLPGPTELYRYTMSNDTRPSYAQPDQQLLSLHQLSEVSRENWHFNTITDDFYTRTLWYYTELVPVWKLGYLQTSATVPSLAAAYALMSLGQNISGHLEASMYQPWVNRSCVVSQVDINSVSNETYVNFGNLSAFLNDRISVAETIFSYNRSSARSTTGFSQVLYNPPGYEDALSYYSFHRSDVNSSLVSVFTRNFSTYTEVSACLIDASYVKGSFNLSGDSRTVSLASVDPEDRLPIPIDLDPGWMQGLCWLPFWSMFTMPAIIALGISYDLWNNFNNDTWWTFDKTAIPLHTQPDEAKFHVARSALAKYSMITSPSDTSFENWPLANTTYLEVKNFTVGYGYDGSTIPVQLSLAVLCSYVIMITIYLLFLLSTGYTATSWTSIGELFMLALNSERPTKMHGTSVGVETFVTYQNQVNIRINEKHTAELVVDGDPRSNTKLFMLAEAGKKYM